jgi:DNA-binding FadR family transcriptional regulator
MSDTDPLGERIYVRLKEDVTNGHIMMHERLDFAELSQRYAVSTTPVREAAMRLLGEGLLEPHPKGGLRPIHLTPADLAAGLELHGQLAALALRWTREEPMATGDVPLERGRRGQLFFIDLARRTGNAELIRIVQQIEDRLARFARFDDRLLTGVDEEITGLWTASRDRLRLLLRRYHRRRLAIVERSIALAAIEEDAVQI